MRNGAMSDTRRPPHTPVIESTRTAAPLGSTSRADVEAV